MTNQEGNIPEWEQSLLSAIESEIQQLEYLIADDSGDTGLPDIHAQISRISGLTDLTFNEGFKFSQRTRNEIQRLGELSMALMRRRLEFTPPSPEWIAEVERGAAESLYEAIALNLPYLIQADSSKYAIALSKEAFAILRKHAGERGDFEMMERMVLVQDYRVMKLAGDTRSN
jgi:hypothetical protein